MKVYNWDHIETDLVETDCKTAISIGVFDGVHLGHQTLISRIIKNPCGAVPFVVTFKQNPARILKPSEFPGDLFTLEQKLAKLADQGVQGVILIDFSSDISKLSGKVFLHLLLDKVNMCFLAVGFNFHCGHNMDTSALKAREYLSGIIPVDILEPVMYEGQRVSSSRIRQSILKGRFDMVTRLLGSEYSLDVSQAQRKKEHGHVVLQKEAVEQIVPISGSFPILLKNEGGTRKGRIEINESTLRWKEPENFYTTNIIFSE